VDFVIVAITVLFGAGLTFFSGFGLGTLLLPVFSIFFDVQIAIGATAIVHLANNIFKFALVSRYIHLKTLLLFGLPAMAFAWAGSKLLVYLGDSDPVGSYALFEHVFYLTPINIVIGILMIFFAWFELDPRFSKMNISKNLLPLGGALSGFFGGVSGHQGAFRAAFLSKAGITKEQFVGTSNAISLVVDLVRLATYFMAASILLKSGAENIEPDNTYLAALNEGRSLLIVGVVCAFIGTFIGKQLIQKTTIQGIQRIVGTLLLVMGSLMIAGIV
jgi:uncharacterized membrane protein YfcA